jgi:hypothetical protein
MLKKPFGGPQQVIEYLGRYTHKVAITNNRIKAVDDNTTTVTFDYKDYNCEGMQKQMQLPAAEFIRRFEQHILPRYFTKIRSYGYIGNRNRKANINAITSCMEIPPHPPAVKIPWQVRLLERYKICLVPTLSGHTLPPWTQTKNLKNQGEGRTYNRVDGLTACRR